MLGGKLVLQYNQSQDLSVYASINRGYKLGGFNPDQRLTEQNRIFKPEFNWNYEVGMKRDLFDNTGYVRFALFFTDRKDSQVSDFVLEEITGTNREEFLDAIINADVGRNYGMELESSFQLADNVSVFANLGLLNAKVGKRRNAKNEIVPERDLAQAPSYTFNIGTEIDLMPNLLLRIEADGKDEYFFSDGHNEKSNSFTLVNARLSYQLDEWSLALWGKNLFDREYYVRGFGGFSNDPRDNYANAQPYYQFGDGRMLGVSASYQF